MDWLLAIKQDKCITGCHGGLAVRDVCTLKAKNPGVLTLLANSMVHQLKVDVCMSFLV